MEAWVCPGCSPGSVAAASSSSCWLSVIPGLAVGTAPICKGCTVAQARIQQRGREERETGFSILCCWSTPQMAQTGRVGLLQSRDPGVSSKALGRPPLLS